MLIHTLVFAILSILSAIAIDAVGKPVGKLPPASELPDTDAADGADEEAHPPL